MIQPDFDVVVAGGGPAGSVCALLLSRSGWRVLLAIGHKRHRTAAPEMISPKGVHQLRSLGLGSALDVPGTLACRGVLSHWQVDGPEFVDFAKTQLAEGVWLNRATFDRFLIDQASTAGVTVVSKEVSATDSFDKHRIIFDRNPNEVITASFVVEAGGRTGGCYRGSPSRRYYFDRLIAIPITPSASSVQNNEILHLAPTLLGWWYTMGTLSHPTSVVFLTDADLLPHSPHERQQFIRHEFAGISAGAVFSGIAAIMDRDFECLPIIDARTTCRQTICQRGWLPVGDAFFTLDPLSGDGLTRGLRMSQASSIVIDQYLREPNSDLLEKYCADYFSEFTSQLNTGQELYRQVAVRYPQSPFWNRRQSLSFKSISLN